MQSGYVEASQNSLDQLKKQRQQIKENLSKKEAEIVTVLEEIAQLHEEITNIEQEINELDNNITETEEKILTYEKEFYQLVDEINILNEAIEARSEILNNRLVAYQENGGDISFLEVILNAKTFTDFISRVSSVSTITNADRELIEQQTVDKEKVERHQQAILEKINKQQQLVDKLEKTKATIKEKSAVLKKSEKEMKQKEKQLKKEKAKLSSEDSELSKLEQSYRKEMNSRDEQVTTKASNNKSKQERFQVGETYRMASTAYTPFCKGCSGYTATGINVKGKQHQRIIAVDPSVIPLGTRVWVEGYGEAIAADTGSSIVGNKIDVLFKSKSQALQWGRRTVTVKVLE